MSKIQNAFRNGKAFIAFLTAGDPTAEATVENILKMEEAGADLIEIGIPFSDPTAEGAVIQDANIRALQAGMTTVGVFDLIRRVREKSHVPLVLYTYLNPVYHYGYDRFFARCQELEVDGILIPDLPFEEKHEVSEVASRYDVDVISMISSISRERIQRIARDAAGFIVAASSGKAVSTDQLLSWIREAADVPCVVEFDDETPEQAYDASRRADGVIVGSSLIKRIERYGENAAEPVYEYVKSIKRAICE